MFGMDSAIYRFMLKKPTQETLSQMDLWKIIERGSETKRIPGKSDSLLAVYKGRFTYTFILDGEVASIHFDAEKGKIFFKGSHIINIELTESLKESLRKMGEILKIDDRVGELLGLYEATLERSMDDN